MASTHRKRILLVHSYYSSRQSSGENRAVEQQVGALRRAGHEVRVSAQRTDDRERSRLYPVEAAATVTTGIGPSPLRDIAEFAPDVIHVHNLFPNFGRRWVRHAEALVVATVHNFRPLCPAATFFRDGHACTDCLDQRSTRPAVQHGCYRGSRAHTLPLAVSTRFGRDPVLASVSRLVVLNDAMRDLYARAGVDRGLMTVVPNFLPDDVDTGAGDGGDYWLFVGRLSPEKGILDVVSGWPSGQRLLVVGGGPLAEEVARDAAPGVELLGERSPAEVRVLMQGARGLVFPSRWFEGSPLVYPEALAAGTPVLAWEPSSVAGLVAADGTGAVVRGGLAKVVEEAAAAFPALRARCRSVFEQRYTETAWRGAIESVYSDYGVSTA